MRGRSGSRTSRAPGFGYVVSAGSDLLVKVRVAADGRLAFTDRQPTRPATSTSTTRRTRRPPGANAGKNPQGIAVNAAGTRAYVTNFVSRNVSVVDLRNDRVIKVDPRPRRRRDRPIGRRS